MIIFIENETSDYFYESLYQLLKKLNDEFKTETNYPSIKVNFTNYIDYSKKEDYKLFLLLKRLSWNDNKRTRKLYEELNVNNYLTFNRSYTEFNDETKGLNYLKEEIQYLKEVFKLSEGEANFLVTCTKGEGLLKVGPDTAILQITPTAKEFEFVETNLNVLVRKRRNG